ncbi:wax ester/triacylglycerol synthase family O-acyltransferase [Geodermatophilus sp. TF02-6]|nr:wax ester/triacylglycerol synthase family O-acyltransferase [Geodermatophilus sp. TF02-6]
MSAQDTSFLQIESDNQPMHVGFVSIFEGPAPGYGDLVRRIAAKLHLVPRYRQRVRFVPGMLGRPVWTDDEHFQILYHVRHTAVPSPGGDEQLRNLAGRVLAQHLDRAKPLWEMWLVEGLEGGRWAIISKIHHAMVDGVSATNLMTVLFDSAPDAAEAPAPEWRPQRSPSGVRLLAGAFADGVTAPLENLAAASPLLRTARSPVEPMRLARRLASRPLRRTVTSLNGPTGPNRRWRWVAQSLGDAKAVRTALGGTVNDVVLAVITRGFRDLLLHRGERVEGSIVRTMVPVSVRASAEHGVPNNRVSAVYAELPVGIADPVERLADIRAQMDGLKESGQAVAGDVLVRLAGFAPAMLLDLGARAAARWPNWLVQTVTTNVPGPRTPLYLLGRRLETYHPYVPLGGQVRIGVAIISYLDFLNFGVTADFDTVPDIDVLGDGISTGLAEYVDLAGSSPTAGSFSEG